MAWIRSQLSLLENKITHKSDPIIQIVPDDNVIKEIVIILGVMT